MLLLVASVWGQVAPPFDPLTQDFGHRFEPPGLRHPFGTDQFGRDVLSRLLAGTLPMVVVAGGSTLLATAIGIPVGLVCAGAGRAGMLVSRLLDGVQAFPSLLLALVWVAVLQPSYAALILAIGLSFCPLIARVTQAAVENELPREYVLAARAIGQRPFWILTRHVLPNGTSALLVQATTILALAMLNEAALSFLGLGPPSASPTWGRMLFDARAFLELAPHLTLAPLLAIAGAVLASNLLGDGLADALDPTISAQRLN
jgi:peptide/nickel transport system permease protein